MKKFSLPFRGGIDFFLPYPLKKEDPIKQITLLNETLSKYSDKIYDVFFPNPFTRSCIPTSKFDINLLRQVVLTCNKYNVKKEMLFNSACMEDINIDIIKFCEDENIDAVTIANYYLLDKVYKQKIAKNSHVKIIASVVMFISNKQTYDYIKHMLDGLVIAVDAIPDKQFVQEMIDSGKIVKAVINDGCINQCPYKRIHLALDGHKSTGETIYIGYSEGESLRGGCRCNLHFNAEVFNNLPILYPTDSYVNNVIWKINGRHLFENNYKYIIDCYLNETMGDKSKENLLGVRGWINNEAIHP